MKTEETGGAVLGSWMRSGQGSVPAPLLGPEVGSWAQGPGVDHTGPPWEGGERAARRGKLRAQPPRDFQTRRPGPHQHL